MWQPFIFLPAGPKALGTLWHHIFILKLPPQLSSTLTLARFLHPHSGIPDLISP